MVAMARRILRDYSESNINDVLNDVEFYIVIDGTLPPDQIVELIIKEIWDRGLSWVYRFWFLFNVSHSNDDG